MKKGEEKIDIRNMEEIKAAEPCRCRVKGVLTCADKGVSIQPAMKPEKASE